MQIVLEPADLKRLSATAREEVLRLVRGEEASPPTPKPNKKGFRWRAPYDLTPDLARKLVRGIGEESRRRLALFAREGGRASMQELLAVTKESDLHVLSAFEGALTRKLRRLVGDDEKIVSLIMWDYDSERWDSTHTRLLDGTYYVSEATSRALRRVLGGA
jgi:hypothetical protein